MNAEGQVPVRTEPQPPGDLFAPPLPPRPDPGTGGGPSTPPHPIGQPGKQQAPPRARAEWVLPVVLSAVALTAMLGLITVAELGSAEETTPLPPFPRSTGQPWSAATPEPTEPTGPTETSEPPATPVAPGELGVTAEEVEVDTAVDLPGPGSRDWVAPGASGNDGTLVRAYRAEELIEFRAADTQPGRDGPFRVSWEGGDEVAESGESVTILGVRPGGRVEFVLRPLDTPGELVMHVSGNVSVTVRTDDDSARTTVSAQAAEVTAALPADTAATVTISPAGDTEIGVDTAELR